MEKQLLSPDKMKQIPGYYHRQTIRSIRLLALIARSIWISFKQSKTGFYSFRKTR
ncbi:MAG: hypothetical protein H8E21_05020 [Gammaproteobacteria bacterium]|nr:hypothetical protein [Gammaproteobacteria bacterium]